MNSSTVIDCLSVLMLVIVTLVLVIVKAEVRGLIKESHPRVEETTSQTVRESFADGDYRVDTNDNHPDFSALAGSELCQHETKIKLKRCQGFRTTSRKVYIPTLIKGACYQKVEVEIEDTLTRCPTGQAPNKTRVKTISENGFTNHLQSQTMEPSEEGLDEEAIYLNSLYTLLRNDVFFLDSGYLSVGIDNTSWYYNPNEFCIENIRGSGNETVVEFNTCDFDETRPLYPKCCPYGMVLGSNLDGCLPSDPIQGPKIFDKASHKLIEFSKANPIYTSPQLGCGPQERQEPWDFDNCTIVFYPATDNSVAFVGAHRTWEFLKANVPKCYDFKIVENTTNFLPVVIHCTDDTNSTRDKDSQMRVSMLYMVMMYIGAGFHLLTTLVYLVTWTKQNIHGKTLCSCTASLFFMQIFLGTAHLLGLGSFGNQRSSAFCYINSVGGQYFMIAAFTWLLVVNIDLWRTFRSIRADGSKSLKRFLSYSAFGWGFPLFISAISIALEHTFKCRASGVPVPEFGEHYCFVSPWAQGFYVYYILGFLITLTCVFAALTLFGLYSFKKDTSNLRSSKRSADKQNVLLFLKLGVVMGLTWTFEVISWAATKEDHENSLIWILLDLYNALSAILIFIIFVCKRTTLNLLEQTLPFLTGISAAFTKFTSTFTGESTSDNTHSTTVPGLNSTTSKKSIELNAFKKEEGSTNNGYQ